MSTETTTRPAERRLHKGGMAEDLAAMEPPLSDLFLNLIIPSYLTAADLSNLSAVCRRYRHLFRSSESSGPALISGVLKRDATHEGGKYRDQLPTFGRLDPGGSLTEDPWMVAKLQAAALRRRRIVHLHLGQNTEEDIQLVVNSYRAKLWSPRDAALLPPSQRNGMPGMTRFLCFNESNQDIYCHWIGLGGTIEVRRGDRIPPSTTPGPRRSLSGFNLPLHVFSHTSYSYHSFALCLEEGGPPFAIYQQRRCWTTCRLDNAGMIMHCHAIAVLPRRPTTEVHLEELHCNALFARHRFNFLLSDRQTGANLPSSEGHLIEDHHAVPQTAQALAAAYYGTHVPHSDEQIWQVPFPTWAIPPVAVHISRGQEAMSQRVQLMSLNYPSLVGELAFSDDQSDDEDQSVVVEMAFRDHQSDDEDRPAVVEMAYSDRSEDEDLSVEDELAPLLDELSSLAHELIFDDQPEEGDL